MIKTGNKIRRFIAALVISSVAFVATAADFVACEANDASVGSTSSGMHDGHGNAESDQLVEEQGAEATFCDCCTECTFPCLLSGSPAPVAQPAAMTFALRDGIIYSPWAARVHYGPAPVPIFRPPISAI